MRQVASRISRGSTGVSSSAFGGSVLGAPSLFASHGSQRVSPGVSSSVGSRMSSPTKVRCGRGDSIKKSRPPTRCRSAGRRSCSAPRRQVRRRAEEDVHVIRALRRQRVACDVRGVRQQEQRLGGVGESVTNTSGVPGCRSVGRDPAGERQVCHLVGGGVGELVAPVAHGRRDDQRRQHQADRPRQPPAAEPLAERHQAECGEHRQAEREHQDPVRREPAGRGAERERDGAHAGPRQEETARESVRAERTGGGERGRHERGVAAPVDEKAIQVGATQGVQLTGRAQERVGGRLARRCGLPDRRGDEPGRRSHHRRAAPR